MIDTIYLENSVASYDRVKSITRRFPEAVRVPCERYQEVFNPKAQNFRLQKKRPALIPVSYTHLTLPTICSV